MSLPPRKRNYNFTPTKNHRQNLTPLQTLLQMGFAKNRAEKALAATGNRDVQLASDWLLAHVNDSFLDESIPREYILYACPTGPFLQQLEEFWEKTNNVCGFNGAHSINIPHITLVSFFKAHDEYAPQISKVLQTIMEGPGHHHLNKPLALELYTSSNFMGFFVAEDDANYLKRLALQYVKEISHSIISETYENLDALITCFPWCSGISGVQSTRCIPKSSRSISLETQPHVKSLHLTLAYQFPPNKFDELLTMVEDLDPSCADSWELRLYSRDPRLATKQVHKVLFPHTPREPDELELRIGDFIYIKPESLQNSSDGWVDGVSWLTGNSGYLPENYTQRTAESDAWTLHCSIPLSDPTVLSVDTNVCSTVSVGEDLIDGCGSLTKNPSHEQLLLSNSQLSSSCEMTSQKSPQKIVILRHGERVDFTFGNGWYNHCFKTGKYVRRDLNLPEHLEERPDQAWLKDCPLTMVGLYQAKLVGNSLKQNNVKFKHAIVSPSYRCVQTCHEILKELDLNNDVQMNIEPGIFEWLAWYQDGLPNWFTPEELVTQYNINLNYKPVVNRIDLEAHFQENLDEFYNRNSQAIQSILETLDGNVLVVAHATTLDTCTRQLIGRPIRTISAMSRLMQKIPYLSASAMEKVENSDTYKLVEPPCMTLTHNSSQKFNWEMLNDN